MSAPVCSTAVRAPRALELIGAPSDCGANLAGACAGPQALRAAGLVPALRALGLQVHDGGDLRGPARPAHSTGTGMDIRTGCHHLALLRASGAVGSLDVMELNPARDVRHQTAQRVVQALQSLWVEPTRAQ